MFERSKSNYYTSKYEKNTALKHKKLLSKELKEKLRIKDTEFKYHSESTDEIILDILHFLLMYLNTKEKQVKQQSSEVKSKWSTVDKYMFIHPNALADAELIKTAPYC